MSPWDSAELLTLAQAAEALGIKHARPGRWLRRYLQRREEATGHELLVSRGEGRGRGARYHVSMRELRAVCPELTEPHRRLETALKADIGELAERVERVEITLADLSSRVVQLTECVHLLIDAMKQMKAVVRAE